MRISLRYPITVGVAAIALGVAGGAAPALAANNNTLIIGSAVSLTGKYATNGIITQRGYDLGVKRINCKVSVLAAIHETLTLPAAACPV